MFTPTFELNWDFTHKEIALLWFWWRMSRFDHFPKLAKTTWKQQFEHLNYFLVIDIPIKTL